MQDFFRGVLPDEGCYRLVLLPTDKPAKTLWAHSLDELTALAEKHAGVERVYFGTAAYSEPTKGKAENVLANKALRLDIDAGAVKFEKHKGEGVYRSQRDALMALRDFTSATRLTPSYVISSGEGLHVYYALDRALGPVEWAAYAGRLYELCEASGLLVDHTTTTDITRLLRVPGTMHEAGKPVRRLVGNGSPLTTDQLDELLPRRGEYDVDDMALSDEFLDAIAVDREYPPSSAFKIAEKCASLRHIVDTGGDVPEPQWRAMIGLVKHTIEGEEQVHDWSAGYDGYDWNETQKKIDLWRTGPTSCDEFAKHCASCSGCQYRGKIKSPIQLGQLNDKEQAELPPEQQTTLAETPQPEKAGRPWDGMLPPGARTVQDDNGRYHLQFQVVQITKDEDDKPVTTRVWVPISNMVFWFGQWGEATSSTDDAQVVLCVWTGTHVARYEVNQKLFASPAKMTEELAGKAVLVGVHPLAAKAAFHYGKTQYMHIQHLYKNLRVTDRFGVRLLESGELVSVHGRYTVHGDGVIRDTILSAALRSEAPGYPIPLPPAEPGVDSWGPEVWDSHIIPAARRHVDFLNTHYGRDEMMPYQLSIMMMLASPLMAFVTNSYRSPGKLPGQSALTVSLYSRDGGYGKTAACQAAAIAYGNPNHLVIGQGATAATEFARFARLSAAGTMPSVMDEMGSLTPRQVATLLSNVANGSPRIRLRRDGSVIETSNWALINVITTNRSLQELLTAGDFQEGDAVHRRILEIDVGGMPRPDRDQRTRFASEFGAVADQCAGALGAVLEREVARIGVDGMNDLVSNWTNQADAYSKAETGDRFFYRAMGAMLAAYAILHKLGLAPFKAKNLLAAYLKAFKASQTTIDTISISRNPLEMLNRAIHELSPHTVVTASHGTRSDSGRVEPVLNARMPDMIKARLFRDAGTLWLSVDALKEWAASKHYSEREMIHAADAAGVLVRPFSTAPTKRRAVRKMLTRGIQTEDGILVYAYELNMHRLQQELNREGGEVPEGEPAEVVSMAEARAARAVPEPDGQSGAAVEGAN